MTTRHETRHLNGYSLTNKVNNYVTVEKSRSRKCVLKHYKVKMSLPRGRSQEVQEVGGKGGIANACLHLRLLSI